MTTEQRLERIERIAKLFFRAGLRERRNRQYLDEKINIIVNYQIQNEERFAKNEERFAKNEERFAKLTDTVNQLAEAQTGTDRRLNSLIELIERDRNGKSH
jgi:ribosomal protein S16